MSVCSSAGQSICLLSRGSRVRIAAGVNQRGQDKVPILSNFCQPSDENAKCESTLSCSSANERRLESFCQVMKSRRQNSELPFNASEQENRGRRKFKRGRTFVLPLLNLCVSATRNSQGRSPYVFERGASRERRTFAKRMKFFEAKSVGSFNASDSRQSTAAQIKRQDKKLSCLLICLINVYKLASLKY